MFFKVQVTRHQVQTQIFIVEADSQADLQQHLSELDFGFIDSRFDEGEVESVEYHVGNMKQVDKPVGKTFADEDLQHMLDLVR